MNQPRSLVVLAALVASHTASAAVVNDRTGVDYPTLEEAVEASAPGDTLRLEAGEYLVGGITIQHDLAFVSAEGATIVGDGFLPLITLDSDDDPSISFDGVDFDLAGRQGLTGEGSLTVTNATIEGASGSFTSTRGSVTLIDVTASGLTKLVDGGSGVILVENCSLSDNTLPGRLIEADDADVSILNTTLDSSGGITIDFGSLVVRDSAFTNVATTRGAAAYVNGDLTVERSTFALGEGIAADGDGLVTVVESDFADLASPQGGCARLVGAAVDVSDSTFARCVARGGDLYTPEDTIDAPGHGGALFAQAAAVTLHDLLVHDSEALGSGGGIAVLGADAAELDSNRLFRNTAGGSGGGAFLDAAVDAASWRNDYCANTSTGRGDPEAGPDAPRVGGGGLAIQGRFGARAYNDVYRDNYANDKGGGLLAYTTGPAFPMPVGNVTLVDNVALTGAMLYNGLLDMDLSMSILLGSPPTTTGSLFIDHSTYDRDSFITPTIDIGDDVLFGIDDPGFVAYLPDDCEGSRMWLTPDAFAVDLFEVDRVSVFPDPDAGPLADAGFSGGPGAPEWLWADDDGDDSPWWLDCDDLLADRTPGGIEVCDGIDNDCDDLVDDDDPDARGDTELFPDLDGDGFGDLWALPTLRCDPDIEGVALSNDDCDDSNPDINPDAEEHCDRIDWNCDGLAEAGAVEAVSWFWDQDGDGYGMDTDEVVACEAPPDHAPQGGDCDDTRDDTFPGAPELCDRWDNDCDDEWDEPDAIDAIDWYRDADIDGWGDPDTAVRACEPPPGHTDQPGDCDDDDYTTYPGAPELCDAGDNDCDGEADEGLALFDWYPDADGDGFGTDGVAVEDCARPDGYADNTDDCDDTNDARFPGNPEVCDSLDNDCNDTIDDDAVDATEWFADADGDGFGDAEDRQLSCDPPSGFVDNADDCNDSDAATNPQGTDVPGNGVDEDCSGDDAVGSTDPTGGGGGGGGGGSGCGCSSPGPSSSLAWWLLPLTLILRRRAS